MTNGFVFLAALTIATPAFAAPGIDLSANHICPGVAGSNSDGGTLDCLALAEAGKLVSIYSTFFTAENISDLSNLDGTVHVTIGTPGNWNTTGAFWDGTPGACLDAHGGSVKFLGSKPVNGDPCGTSLAIKECFADGSALTTVKNDGNNMDLFYTVYKVGSQSVTTSMRLFGWEIRYDPAYATEACGPCGTCTDPIYWVSVEARPGSFAGNPTTPLHTSTGTTPYNGNFAYYNNIVTSNAVAGGCPVALRARTWGQLKLLYR